MYSVYNYIILNLFFIKSIEQNIYLYYILFIFILYICFLFKVLFESKIENTQK